MLPALEEGGKFGKFSLISLLVGNPLTKVFLARSRNVSGDYEYSVLKCLRPEYSDDAFAWAFNQDSRVSVQFMHKNIVRTVDAGEIDGISCLAMERIIGVDLLAVFGHAKRQGQPLPIELVLCMVCDICDALDYIHNFRGGDGRELGLVHRNISLPNLMVDGDGVLKVMDYGVSGSMEDMERRQDILFMGRSDYSSPEYALGQGLDGRSDIFSIGIVLHEMITGHRLFFKDGKRILPSELPEAQIDPPSLIRRNLPQQIDQLVMTALAKDPDERYSSVREMKAAVLEILGKNPEQIRDSLFDYLFERFPDQFADADDDGYPDDSAEDDSSSNNPDPSGAYQWGNKMSDNSQNQSVNMQMGSYGAERASVKTGKKSVISGLLRLFAFLVFMGMAGAAFWIFWLEKNRPPWWSLEAWQESQGGKMAGAEPLEFTPEMIAEIEERKKRQEAEAAKSVALKHKSDGAAERSEPLMQEKKLKTGKAKTAASGSGETLKGQLLVVCERNCSVYVDGRRGRPDSSGVFNIPVGQREIKIVDDASKREQINRVLIAPGRVHVEEADFPPLFLERTGTEDW